MLLRLITFRQQLIKSILSKFLKQDVIYNSEPFIMGSTNTSIDPKEFNTGNIIYASEPVTVIFKE